MSSLKQSIEQLRTWLNSRKLVYYEPLQEIDFAKDIDNGLKLLENVEKESVELKQKLQQLLKEFPTIPEGKSDDIWEGLIVNLACWKEKFEELLT